jgi:hypothetical protein
MSHERRPNQGPGIESRSAAPAIPSVRKSFLFLVLLLGWAAVGFFAGLGYSRRADAATGVSVRGEAEARPPRVVYPERTELDFEGVQIEGEVRNPGDFYYQARSQEKFDSLVKRRKNFHQQMLRDAALSR